METLLTESLWGDEGFSAMAVQLPFGEMLGVVMRDTAPPLFYVVGWLWGRLFGFSEVSLRSLSMLLMLGAAWFAGRMVWEIGKDRWAALAAGILAFSAPFVLPFAFEWRMYALFAATIMGSVYCFVTRRSWGYVVATVAALYTHHYALFTLAGQVIWYMLTEFDWKRPWASGKRMWPFWVVLGLYLPWIYPFYLQLTRVRGAGFWLASPTLAELSNLLHRFLTGGIAPALRTSTLVLVVLLLAGKRWEAIGRKWLELLMLFLTPVLMAFGVSILVTPIFYDRYLLSLVMGIVVLHTLGVKRWVTPALVALVVVFLVTAVRLFTHPTKRPFRALASYIRETRQEGEIMLNHNGKAHHLWESKYYGIEAPIYTPHGPLPLYVGTAQMGPEDTITEIPQARRLGVISSDPVGEVVLPEPWTLSEVVEFGELKVLWFTPFKGDSLKG